MKAAPDGNANTKYVCNSEKKTIVMNNVEVPIVNCMYKNALSKTKKKAPEGDHLIYLNAKYI